VAVSYLLALAGLCNLKKRRPIYNPEQNLKQELWLGNLPTPSMELVTHYTRFFFDFSLAHSEQVHWQPDLIKFTFVTVIKKSQACTKDKLYQQLTKSETWATEYHSVL
jgi:hypothetical protein